MRAWFQCDIGALSVADRQQIVNILVAGKAVRRLDPNPEDVKSWEATVDLMQAAATAIMAKRPEAARWHVFLEFEVPRRRKRIDIVLVADDLVCIGEVKAGAARFDRAAKWQIEQYALDLRDFHEGSRAKVIVPFVIATSAQSSEPFSATPPDDFVSPVQAVTPSDFASRLLLVHSLLSNPQAPRLQAQVWEDAAYRPTPSIVEAARELYEGHDVRDIAAADSHNLDVTVAAIVGLVKRCLNENRKGIAFITGAPGSGKTLAGLQVVHNPQLAGEETASIFLSGNMPLVDVISDALASSATRASGARRDTSRRQVSAFIQHAYVFRNEYAEHPEKLPYEHVVLFDEAQRAWDAAQVSKWTRGTSKRSEPELVLDIMSRHSDWAVIVAMVGGGQEINRGEAGLREWGRALRSKYRDWIVVASPAVLKGASVAPGGTLFDELPDGQTIVADPRLHLAMNVRSPRAERLNQWVDGMLSLDVATAKHSVPQPREFPMVMTRSLSAAKSWLRDRADEDQRFGLVASSSARRLRAWGLDTSSLRQDKAWGNWFLKERGDVRSSFQLEVPANSFDCQGLELDWVGVCWGNDLVHGRNDYGVCG